MSEQVDKLQKLLEVLQNDTLRPKDVERLLDVMLTTIKKSTDTFEAVSSERLKKFEAVAKKAQSDINKKMAVVVAGMDDRSNKTLVELNGKMQEAKQLLADIQAIEVKDGRDGKDADPEQVIAEVLKRMPTPPVYTPDEGEEIVAKINGLPTDKPEYMIDISHIKGMPKSIISNSNKYLGQMLDVDLSGVTYTNGKYVLGSGGGVTPADLTRTNDTNVTITLGGTPTGSLLQAVSLTMGWSGQLSIARGGTGQSSANAALNALLPSQTGNNGKYLQTDGTNTSWASAAGSSGITRTIASISSDTNAGATASTDYVYLVSGTATLTLPTAVGNTNRYTVKNVGSNTVTIATTSSQTIDGSSSATLPVANTSLDLISDGTNWQII